MRLFILLLLVSLICGCMPSPSTEAKRIEGIIKSVNGINSSLCSFHKVQITFEDGRVVILTYDADNVFCFRIGKPVTLVVSHYGNLLAVKKL